MPLKAGYLLAAGGGAILLYSGLRGKSWSGVLRNVISGKPITTTPDNPIFTAPQAYAYGQAPVPAHGGGSSTGNAISDDALRYVGSWHYVWGGAPGSGERGDCSSFANAVIGRDLGLAIPLYRPGAYHGQSHGPNTLVWMAWSGAFTIKRQDAAAGDLAVWQTHMGIFTGPNTVVSALDVQLGVKNLSVSQTAPPLEKLLVRRLKAVTVRG